MRQIKLLFLFVFLLASRAFAQSVHWEPPGGQLGFNQVSELSLVFTDCEPNQANIQLPTVGGLVFGRPSQSSQTSIENFSVTRTYSLIFPVRPDRRSGITIPAFDVPTDKGTLHVAAANFTVGDATVGNSGVAISDIASAQLTTPKTSLWAGEVFPVNWNLTIVRRYFYSPATNLEWNPAPLVAEEWSKAEPVETLIRNERYVVSNQTTRAMAPQPGTLTIKPASQLINLLAGNSNFGFFSQPALERRQIDSSPLTLTVNPLPPAPPGFTGAVGDFTFTSKVIPTSGAIGEPITWTVQLAGTGNWQDITGLPQRDVSNDFQIFQPKTQRTMKDGSLFEGTLSEDVVLVPTKVGTYQLPAVHFIYFDPKSGTYKTLASEPSTVTVTAPQASPLAAPGNGAPIQFALNPNGSSAPTAASGPASVPPVAPDNLPRDAVRGPGRGVTPFALRSLVNLCLAVALIAPLLLWIFLAAIRSRELDPQRPRRLAKAELAKILGELRSAGSNANAVETKVRAWQQKTAAVWQIPHAAPGSRLVHTAVGIYAAEAASEWTKLWSESERILHSREKALPSDWVNRADAALTAVQIPDWSPSSLFFPRHLLPSVAQDEKMKGAMRLSIWLVLVISLSALPTAVFGENPATAAYKSGDFPAAEKQWREALATAPSDWTARHNLGLALAQQDRWPEATAYWTGAFLLNSRAEATHWDLALGLQHSGLAPSELVDFSRGQGLYHFARFATPGEWQLALVLAAVFFAATLIILILEGYRRIGGWGKPTALVLCLFTVLLAASATLGLNTYGVLADRGAVLVWKSSTLRSIPTEADTTQKTSALSAGSIAIAEKTFLGWTELSFASGQTGWARSDDLIALYR